MEDRRSFIFYLFIIIIYYCLFSEIVSLLDAVTCKCLRQHNITSVWPLITVPRLSVFYLSALPSFLKTPMDLTIRTGTMARLECAAEGHPSPQIAWQKDGGTDFPAARERRMHVMPDDDIFFIANVKTEDMGVYSCTAQNAAGSLSANATLTVLGKSPTWLTERVTNVFLLGHFRLSHSTQIGCSFMCVTHYTSLFWCFLLFNFN